MTSRRKDMWRLLYNLVNRSNASLNDVYNFVDDILCKEPSLLRCYSITAVVNKFQDTFIIWLVNKLLRFLIDNTDAQMRLKNLQLQQRIITSCLVNHPSLFKSLVSAYVDALEQLAYKLTEVETENDNTQLELKIFQCDTSPLCDIDPSCTMPNISIRLSNADQQIRDFLYVLEDALNVGNGMHCEIFIDSMLITLCALKESDCTTKIRCLRYCYAVASKQIDSVWTDYHLALASNTASIMRVISIMWEYVGNWICEDCMSPTDIDDFACVTCDWITIFAQHLKDMNLDTQESFNICLIMLISIAELSSITEYNLVELIGSSVNLLLQLQLVVFSSLEIEMQHLKSLIRLSKTAPVLLRVLAVLCARRDIKTQRQTILEYFQQRLEYLFEKSIHTDLELLELSELLIALKFLEHSSVQQKQINILSDNTNTLETFYAENYTLEMNLFEKKIDWQTHVTKYLENVNIETATLSKIHIKITGLMLQVCSIRRYLKMPTQKSIISQLEQILLKALASPEQTYNYTPDIIYQAFESFCGIQFDEPSSACNVIQNFFGKANAKLISSNDKTLRELYCKYLPQLYCLGYVKWQCLTCALNLNSVLSDNSILFAILRILFCTNDLQSVHAYKSSPYAKCNADLTFVQCAHCNLTENCNTPLESHKYFLEQDFRWKPWHTSLKKQSASALLKQSTFLKELPQHICMALLQHDKFAAFAPHMHLIKFKSELCLEVISYNNYKSSINMVIYAELITQFGKADEDFMPKLTRQILERIREMLSKSYEEQNLEQQRHALQLLKFSAYPEISEKWLFHLFKMTFFFLMHPNSLVMQEAVLCATELCVSHNLQPINLWNWYKRDALALVVQLALYTYLTKGVRLTRSLRAFTKMLGFSCVQEFVCKYYRLLTTMILPYCIKQPLCKGALVLISKMTRKPISGLFIASFLRIYTHIYLTEEPEIGNKCIELIVQSTASSLQQLMNADVKQTVSEILIYFNRNPTFVMRAFQCLLLQQGSNIEQHQLSTQAAATEFSKFIVDRFLGVITHFESCLSDPNFEKPLKEEALYSMGQIIRFVGANHVTQFRFKIIAMLSFVISLNDIHLQRICLKIWNIFLHVVNVQELGPSLSRIVVSLQPLLEHSETEVNELYEFVILNNVSMLGAYISDLYFLERLDNVSSSIRQCVARQTEILKGTKSTLLEKLNFLHKQITNENSQVRVYGLTYLMEFFAENRVEINRLIQNEMLTDTLIAGTVNILIDGCQHEDLNLRLASAKCIGELGAIDASYMSSNYNFEPPTEIPYGILTDEFAKMALIELCRAYQFQKNTKYIDNFSLAIQETLEMSAISPRNKKKEAIWGSLPERMRQIMEPFLDSCYTGSQRDTTVKAHPIFGSHYCKTYTDWAFLWASRLIECVRTTETKHLLVSYKPSIKRDSNTMATFFPFILLHALQECNEEQETQIYEEFCAVFNFSNMSDGQHQQHQLPQADKLGKSTNEMLPHALIPTNNRIVASSSSANGNIERVEETSNQIRTATKLCSEQIDFLQRWLRQRQSKNKKDSPEKNVHPQRVQLFLKRLDKLQIARANYNSGEYTRALMYLEEYIELDPKERLIEQFSLLIQIYGRLMDADSVEGAVHVHTYDLSITQEILVNRLIDRHQDMIICYEQLLCSKEQFRPEHIRGMVDSYLRMDTPKTALLITDGLWQRFSDQYTDEYFKECKSELLWRLGSYDELQELFEQSTVRQHTTNWHVQCAAACLDFRQLEIDTHQFTESLDIIRTHVLSSMRTCSAVKQNSYAHSYDEVVKLHLLHEMEKCRNLVVSVCDLLAANENNDANDEQRCLTKVRHFFADWNSRLEVLEPSVRVVEPIFGFRRSLLTESKRLMQQVCKAKSSQSSLLDELCSTIDAELGQLWVKSAKINRNAGNLHRAQLSIMNAAQYGPKTLFLEKAALLWQKGDQTISLKLIEENLDAIESKCDGNIRELPSMDRALYSDAKFLQATYNAESMNICSELNLRYFKEAINGNRDSERCYVQLAQYMEKMYESFPEEQQDGEEGRKLLQDIMLNYAKSLRCGSENVYQSLPRLVSLWLDTASRLISLMEQANSDPAIKVKLPGLQELTRKMNDIMNNCSNILPTGIFYTAFSQLLSRICHPSSDVFNVLRTIIIKLIDQYPHQSLWMLLPIYKSSFTNRIKRCRLIFTDTRLSKPDFQKLLTDFNMLAERLIELTNKEVNYDRMYEMSQLVPQLPKLFRNADFSEILLPFEKYMQPCFPLSTAASNFVQTTCTNGETSQSPASTNGGANFPSNLFPHKQIYIRGFKEDITVLRSAAKPKKVTILCSDGNEYNVMLKPKDDMRKDFRLMEFNGLVKRYLHQDSQARHRRLRIRTYAVIPFNEQCGLVEWLPNLNTFRTICYKYYRERDLGISDRMLRSFTVPPTESLEKKRIMFIERLLPKYPPVFHEWFRHQFPTPHAWYEARSAYVKTVAVMSIVGYILGLGDRHGENILLDERTGEAVHVDFNCLFNQGELFAYPELVPFRLTHNMIAAMGPLGIEGTFRKCCEITLRLLKQETRTLMSVLRPFVYDLVVQSRNYTPKKAGAELTDPKATIDVRRIAERLKGHVKKQQIDSMPLSTEGQVNFLISESTNIDNLASMYIGWSAFL